jgi:kanamycin kinase
VLPRRVEEIAGGTTVRVVWLNALGGVTCEYGHGADRRFVKWSPPTGPDLRHETVRLQWAVKFTPVPVVVDHGADEDGTWIVTLPVPGSNAVADRWKADPASACRSIGEGLRAFHEALPVDRCPFSWSAPERVADAERRAAASLIRPSSWHEPHRELTIEDALRRVEDVPGIDELVVCHGDTCAPNTLIGDDGRWAGHVDLGSLGVADRWADLAIATWSADWNYGPGWDQDVLDAYGVSADPDRTRYYRLLWDLGP